MGAVSELEVESKSVPIEKFIAVTADDVDNVNYFIDNIGDAKEIIECNSSGIPNYKKVFYYYKSGGGYTIIQKYIPSKGKWEDAI